MSEYKCEACGKYKTPDNSGLKVGDEVNFTSVRQSGNTMHVSSRDGRITDIDDKCVTIKGKRGHTYLRTRDQVMLKGATGGLHMMLFGECKCSPVGSAT